MNSYMQTGSSGILIMGIVLLLAAAIIYSFMYSIPRNVKRIADTLEVQNAAMRESIMMLAGAVRQSSVSASMQNGNKINVDNVRMDTANMFAEAVIRIREGYITVEQLMRVGISDRTIAVQALVAMGVEVKE